MHYHPIGQKLVDKRISITSLKALFNDFASSVVSSGADYSGKTAIVTYDQDSLSLDIDFIDTKLKCLLLTLDDGDQVNGHIAVYRLNFGLNNANVFVGELVFNQDGMVLDKLSIIEEKPTIFINISKADIFLRLLNMAHDVTAAMPYVTLKE
ncbi:hypothetical protein [Methylovorus mays]|uniref:hypothetical protein n=1 Tax=Methylovorus mays TaxID=184077 RepID=UPI001E5D9D49|nr:hypothetical protein [Methylovorus mays]MCB5206104.1 hypothetical protein [Methylovorus mays]